MIYNTLREVRALRRLYARVPVPLIRGGWWVRTRVLRGYSDANPSRLLWVDPATIRHTEGPGGQCRIGVVMEGDWDQNRKLLVEDTRYADIQKLYRGALASGRRRDVEHGLSRKALAKLDDLLASIREHGYLCQADLLRADGRTTRRLNNDVAHPVLNEIGVNIHRDGALVRTGAGFHRLAMATALGIAAVPVVVRVRHARWQAIRHQFAAARSAASLSPEARAHLDHPDLADLVPPVWRTRPLSPPAG